MCCTPYVATIVAGVLCIFQSFVSLGWNVPLLLGISLNKTEILTLTPIDLSQLENPFLIYGIAILLALINLQLLVFSCLLLKANHDKRSDWVGAWCALIVLKSLANVLLGVYFLYYYKYLAQHGYSQSRQVAYFRIAALFSGIFFFWPLINLILSGMVLVRYYDIKKNVTRITEDESPNVSQPPPYSTGLYIPRQFDPAPISGWSNQPLYNGDSEEN